MLKIARLEADGILNGAGNERWHTSNINNILRNEKYIGDALLQKTYTVDFLTKKRVKNNGIVPQYYVENSHEAIIPREVFMQVQEELIRRRIVHTSPNGKTRTFSSNHVFAQIIICGKCGEVFRRVHWNNRGKEVHRLALCQPVRKHRPILRCPHGTGEHHRASASHRH